MKCRDYGRSAQRRKRYNQFSPTATTDNASRGCSYAATTTSLPIPMRRENRSAREDSHPLAHSVALSRLQKTQISFRPDLSWFNSHSGDAIRLVGFYQSINPSIAHCDLSTLPSGNRYWKRRCLSTFSCRERRARHAAVNFLIVDGIPMTEERYSRKGRAY